MKRVGVLMAVLLFSASVAAQLPTHKPHSDGASALEFLKSLRGSWVVDGGDEGTFGWEFDVTSRGGVVLERLKVGVATEMATVYHLDEGILIASHYCQLGNQPRLSAVRSESKADGDLHFVCDCELSGADSHSELHMHGVHFRDNSESVSIWMDMVKDGEVAFVTSYELVRSSSPNE